MQFYPFRRYNHITDDYFQKSQLKNVLVSVVIPTIYQKYQYYGKIFCQIWFCWPVLGFMKCFDEMSKDRNIYVMFCHLAIRQCRNTIFRSYRPALSVGH